VRWADSGVGDLEGGAEADAAVEAVRRPDPLLGRARTCEVVGIANGRELDPDPRIAAEAAAHREAEAKPGNRQAPEKMLQPVWAMTTRPAHVSPIEKGCRNIDLADPVVGG
jgi:hypothetical protein